MNFCGKILYKIHMAPDFMQIKRFGAGVFLSKTAFIGLDGGCFAVIMYSSKLPLAFSSIFVLAESLVFSGYGSLFPAAL